MICEIGEWAVKGGRFVYHVTLNHRHVRGERPTWVGDAKREVERLKGGGAPAAHVEHAEREAENAEARWLGWRLGEERRATTDAWRRMTSGRIWRDFTAASGWLAVRSMEVTHGSHGWHPHLHLMVTTEVELDGFTLAALASRWRESFRDSRGRPDHERQGIPHIMLHARRLEPSEVGPVANYMTKGIYQGDLEVKAMAEEIASGTGKTSRSGVTPWQLLGQADGTPHPSAGPVAPRTLWRGYTLGMLGARAVTFPKVLLRELGLTELDDLTTALARDEAPEPIAVIGRVAWSGIRRARAWHLLDALCAAAVDGSLTREWLDREWGALAFDVSLKGDDDPPRIECRPEEMCDVARYLALHPDGPALAYG
jgi:hypothetical protein